MTRKAQAQKYLVVRGHLSFPVDMLRYDMCYPDSEEDSLAILRTIIDRQNMTWVVLRQDASVSRSLSSVTAARWQSFGWDVVAIESERHVAREFARTEQQNNKS